jgi:hypothetical protein
MVGKKVRIWRKTSSGKEVIVRVFVCWSIFSHLVFDEGEIVE